MEVVESAPYAFLYLLRDGGDGELLADVMLFPSRHERQLEAGRSRLDRRSVVVAASGWGQDVVCLAAKKTNIKINVFEMVTKPTFTQTIK